ncbi:MAG TPA: PTS sugar transporter subunit IIA [Anaeromyxobacteraceae bacterium]|jgi:PTS system nitrogen regulatory IIA component
MSLADLLVPDGVLEIAGSTPAAVLAELAAPVARAHRMEPARLVAALAEREKLGSTGVGDGVAIPHARVAGLAALAASFGRARAGVDFRAVDGRPVRLFVALLAPDQSAGQHLQALARVSRMLKSAAFREAALAAPDAAALRQVLAAEEAKG